MTYEDGKMTSQASRRITRGSLLALALTLPITAAVPASAAPYTFQTVNYPGDTFTELLGVNDAGTIAGYHGDGTVNPSQGFTLVLPNTFTSENFPGSAQTQVVGINSAGDTGGSYIDFRGVTHGFTKVGGPFTTVDFPGAIAFNQILGLNDNDVVAGYSSTDSTGATLQQGFTETGGIFTPLAQFLPSGTQNNQATDINNGGMVSGFYVDSGGVNHGFLLNGKVLTPLDFAGSTFTQALGLNNQGQVVGDYRDAQGRTHGFVWKNGTLQTVDDPNGTGVTINGINDQGEIVGFFVDSAGNTDGFVGTPVPEPATGLLVMLGVLGLAVGCRRAGVSA
jgi:probable HAF family extracellular repeat protein